ncbi:MAG: type I glutamate--ammonia ligase [Candidatus Wukongarchaeota archaeon]|nr:type I glutamate--ammonia ligase [Candidatus Wukongarchaeota archaeon]MDO8129106.1 type I glutamate--ammonia ligase [Candidatus Wukongarchaeota archaeon]
MVRIRTDYSEESKAKALETAKQRDVKFIRLQFTDLRGIIKSTAITDKHLEDAFEEGIGFDGSSILGFTPIEESDMLLVPDPNTFAILPWRPNDKKVARIICDVYFPSGERFEGDPRYVAQRAAQKAKGMGYVYKCGPELEFFLFQKKEGDVLNPAKIDSGGYFDFHPLDLAEDFRRDMIFSLENFGIEIEMSHHEVAPSQYEVDFRFADLVTTADRVMTYKMVAKTIAHLHGYIASFMPKPIFGVNGSGMHTHQSLWEIEKNKNAFYDPEKMRSDALTDEALYFIGGLLSHAKALAGVVAPTVNSYKRLVPGYEAPVYISWAHKNRSALIRVPEYFPGMEKAIRAEFRCPDPSCNPYLAFACMCNAGLDGIEKKILPPEPVEADIYEMTAKEREELYIGSLPSTLAEALCETEKDDVLKKTLGNHVYENFIKVKRDEWDQFRLQVTPWELEKYLKHS